MKRVTQNFPDRWDTAFGFYAVGVALTIRFTGMTYPWAHILYLTLVIAAFIYCFMARKIAEGQ